MDEVYAQLGGHKTIDHIFHPDEQSEDSVVTNNKSEKITWDWDWNFENFSPGNIFSRFFEHICDFLGVINLHFWKINLKLFSQILLVEVNPYSTQQSTVAVLPIFSTEAYFNTSTIIFLYAHFLSKGTFPAPLPQPHPRFSAHMHKQKYFSQFPHPHTRQYPNATPYPLRKHTYTTKKISNHSHHPLALHRRHNSHSLHKYMLSHISFSHLAPVRMVSLAPVHTPGYNPSIFLIWALAPPVHVCVCVGGSLLYHMSSSHIKLELNILQIQNLSNHGVKRFPSVIHNVSESIYEGSKIFDTMIKYFLFCWLQIVKIESSKFSKSNSFAQLKTKLIHCCKRITGNVTLPHGLAFFLSPPNPGVCLIFSMPLSPRHGPSATHILYKST